MCFWESRRTMKDGMFTTCLRTLEGGGQVKEGVGPHPRQDTILHSLAQGWRHSCAHAATLAGPPDPTASGVHESPHLTCTVICETRSAHLTERREILR